jgi:hypothetical protein
MCGYRGGRSSVIAEVLSRDVKPLKAHRARPMNRCSVTCSPTLRCARTPGRNKAAMDPVEVGEDKWTLIEALANA